MRNVTFAYAPNQPPLFRQFTLRVEPGEKVGLVGRSGGGKTTITRLLLRFADVQADAILVGGQRVDEVSQSALRALIA